MLHIQLLGGIELALGGAPPLLRLGSKPRGLLAVLAMSKDQPVPRSRLAGMLWGERDEGRARHSLCQAMSTIRAALGPAAADLLHTDPESIRLIGDRLTLDVDLFEDAVRAERRETLEEACRLYQGVFLDGLELNEPGFEEWMLTERYRLGDLAAEAFARLLDLQTDAGDLDAAVRTARRLVAIAPFDEAAHARLIGLYGAKGRRGLAEAHYARSTELLHRELGQAPGDGLRAALNDARRCSAGANVRPVAEAHARQARAARAAPWYKAPGATAAAALVVGVLLSVVAGGIYRSGGDDDRPAASSVSLELPAAPSIAVLPFDHLSDDARQDHFADGVTRDVVANLSKFSTLSVIAPGSGPRADGARGAANARELGVRYLLQGSVQRSADTIHVHASLLEAGTGRHLWAEAYQRPADDEFATQREITQTIASVLGSGSGEVVRAEVERIQKVPRDDRTAHDFYLLGLAHKGRTSREANGLARRMFERAVDADPRHAPALAALSRTYLEDLFNDWTDAPREWLTRAEELARAAIELDPSEPWASVALGLVHQMNGRSDQVLPLFERAHALNPNDYEIKQALGYAVTYAGSPERGVDLLEEARLFNPYGLQEPRSLGMAYFFAGRYQEALAIANEVSRRAASPSYWQYKAAIHAQLGQLDQARAAVAEALKLDPDLTLEGEHQRRLAMGLAPANADLLTAALRKAGLPERGPAPEPGRPTASRATD